MGGEEGTAAVDVVQVLDGRPGDGEAVEGRRAAPDLVAALGEIDPDAMTPREALEALYRLKMLSRAAE
jgi:DNA mismatch repair protein MutS